MVSKQQRPEHTSISNYSLWFGSVQSESSGEASTEDGTVSGCSHELDTVRRRRKRSKRRKRRKRRSRRRRRKGEQTFRGLHQFMLEPGHSFAGQTIIRLSVYNKF